MIYIIFLKSQHKLYIKNQKFFHLWNEYVMFRRYVSRNSINLTLKDGILKAKSKIKETKLYLWNRGVALNISCNDNMKAIKL